MAKKYVSFTADDAISNIPDWVDQGNPLDNDSDGGDLDDLYGEDIDMVVRVVHSDGEVDEEDGHHSADKDKDDKDDHRRAVKVIVKSLLLKDERSC